LFPGGCRDLLSVMPVDGIKASAESRRVPGAGPVPSAGASGEPARAESRRVPRAGVR